MPIIVRNLHHVYSQGTPLETPSLRGVTLTIEDGEFVALVGTMGSGKSTLVQHLNGLMKPPPGAVIVDGLDVGSLETPRQRRKTATANVSRTGGRKAVDLLEVRRRVGVVFQYPEQQLFAETVAADVAFGPRNLGLSVDEVKIRVREALTQVGLSYADIKDRSPFTLSGGQQRRVALAGVLAMRPRYLILDEPTAGLDPRGRRELLDLVARLNREHGVAVVLVTHHMEDAARLANKVVVLSHGRVALSGAPSDVLSAEKIDELKQIDMDAPVASKFIAELRRRGWSLPAGIVTEDKAVAAVLQALGKTAAGTGNDTDTEDCGGRAEAPLKDDGADLWWTSAREAHGRHVS